MILYIDPSHGKDVVLRYGEQQQTYTNPRADTLLQQITGLVDGQWSGIALVNQAESFTQIRLLAAISNALAFSKNIALYDLASSTEDIGEPVALIQPHYQSLPNITVAPTA